MSANFGFGQLSPEDFASEFNVLQFLINQALLRVRTITPVQVMNSPSSGTGLVAAPGFVNVQSTVSMTDGQGNIVPHGTVFNVPVFRYGSGNGVVICDPVVGDKGLMAVCDRDISSVKNTKGAVSSPASFRIFDLADGIYLGSLFGSTPKQWLRFFSTGVEFGDMNGNKIQMLPGMISMTCTALVVNGVPMTIP